MRALTIGAVALAAAMSTAFAQPKPAPASDGVRYYILGGNLMGDLPADGIMKETRQGGKVISAELDVCYSTTIAGDHKDRFVIALKTDGAKLTGTGQSSEDKQPIAISLTRNPTGRTMAFEGTITRAGTLSNTSSTENAEMTEAEFKEAQKTDDGIDPAPAEFTDVSPGSLAIKVKRETLVTFVKGLRDQGVKIALYSLVQDCTTLRTGQQIVRVDLDPDRAPAMIAKLKTTPGVTAAGYGAGIYDMNRAVLFPAAGFRDGGKLSRDKIAAVIADVVGKYFRAKMSSTKWDDATGEVTLEFKRDSESVPGLGLTDVVEVTALVGPAKPGASDKMIVWLGGPTIDTSDESAGPKLQFTGNSNGGDDEGPPLDNDETVDGLAAALKGQRWDQEQSAWK